MRRTFVLALLLLLVAPAAAWAVARAPGDGTLSVRNGDGMLFVDMARGAAIGKIAFGQLRVEVLDEANCAGLAVFGAEREFVAPRAETPVCVFQGRDIRFRLIDQNIRFWIGTQKASAFGFSLSMVAKARGSIRGTGGPADGVYSIDGGDYVSLPDDGRRFQLGAGGGAFASVP
jgi:hypothetical protein